MKDNDVNPKLWKIDSNFKHGFIEKEKLELMNLEQSYEMPMDFLDDAYLRGDRCYTIIYGDFLASYGWYTTKKTQITEELLLFFDPAWAYMYKGFTHINYRGQKLHGIGMAYACKQIQEEGHSGLLSVIDYNNFSSLKSSYRLGYKRFGRIIAMKLLHKYIIKGTKGCKKYGFRLKAVTR